MQFKIVIFVVALSGSVFSQSMKIHTKNSVQQFSLSDIDSITFELEEPKGIAELVINAGEISGWNNYNDGIVFFNSSSMASIVNGAAEEYINKGMVKGFHQQMTKEGTDYSFSCLVMDFGTSDNAKQMYTLKLQQYASSREPAGSFGQDVAFIEPSNPYGCDGYANFGKYIIRLTFDNYGPNKNEAKMSVSSFMQMFKSKIDQL